MDAEIPWSLFTANDNQQKFGFQFFRRKHIHVPCIHVRLYVTPQVHNNKRKRNLIYAQNIQSRDDATSCIFTQALIYNMTCITQETQRSHCPWHFLPLHDTFSTSSIKFDNLSKKLCWNFIWRASLTITLKKINKIV